MSSLKTFESTLKEVVHAKRLSASRMGKLTDIALKSMEDDTQLVSILYRTHKSLPTAAKVSSLYAFDALSRAARSQVNKHGLTGDVNAEKGNCATFLLKVEGVLEGLFQDMISAGNSETKEKSKKILDIWTKANTFPSAVLAGLANIVKEAEKEVEPVTADPRTVVESPGTNATPPTLMHVSPPPIPPGVDPAQSTLLALLTQAASVVAAPNNGQTTPNTYVPQLDSSQLALLQQLTKTAKLVNEGSAQSIPLPAPLPLSVPANTAPSEVIGLSQYSGSYREDYYGAGSRESRYDRRGSPSRSHDDYYDDHGASRGNFRGGFRGRGRGDGRGRWNDHDRFRDRSPPPRARRSRSRSPPSRYGGRRDIKPYSPPRRPSMAPLTVKEPSYSAESVSHAPEVEKDEFGRDIRPLSPSRDVFVSANDDLRTQPLPPLAAASVDPMTTPQNNQRSLSPPSVAAKPLSQTLDTLPSNTLSSQPGLDKFDLATFDFTAASSWEALAKMWEVTYGYLPSQEALMQFVISRGTTGPTTLGGQSSPEPAWAEQGWAATHSERGGGQPWQGGRGRGRFLRGGRGSGYRYGDTRDIQEQRGHDQETDAIVLGEDPGLSSSKVEIATSGNSGNQTMSQEVGTTVGAGGRMQRVGDRWVFVREGATGMV